MNVYEFVGLDKMYNMSLNEFKALCLMYEMDVEPNGELMCNEHNECIALSMGRLGIKDMGALLDKSGEVAASEEFQQMVDDVAEESEEEP